MLNRIVVPLQYLIIIIWFHHNSYWNALQLQENNFFFILLSIFIRVIKSFIFQGSVFLSIKLVKFSEFIPYLVALLVLHKVYAHSLDCTEFAKEAPHKLEARLAYAQTLSFYLLRITFTFDGATLSNVDLRFYLN